MTVLAYEPFSFTRAGPFYRLMRRAHGVDRAGKIRARWLAAVSWLPIAIASLLRLAFGHSPDAIFSDPSLHVRLLLAIPLVLAAESLLEARCAGAMEQVQREQLADPTAIAAIYGRAERLRASRLVEAIIAVFAVAGGQAVLWGAAAPTGFLHGVDRATSLTFATLWYDTIALPLLYFLVVRWFWRWIVWTYVLVRLSRVELATNALHPDAAAGLKFLSGPIDGFAMFVAANTVVAAAAWTRQVHVHHVLLSHYVPRWVVFVVVAIACACGPLFLFGGQIYRARRRDSERFHALAYRYVLEFRRRWLLEHAEGTPSFTELNNLGGSFRATEDTRPIPFGLRPVLMLWLAALVPMLPVLIASVPVSELIKGLTDILQLPIIA